jgi:hypothetical protein
MRELRTQLWSARRGLKEAPPEQVGLLCLFLPQWPKIDRGEDSKGMPRTPWRMRSPGQG